MDPAKVRRYFLKQAEKRPIEKKIQKLLTLEDLYIVLGLDPAFKKCPQAPEGRGRGRTTRMLCRATIEGQSKRVLILGFEAEYTKRLQQEAIEMCHRAEIPIDNIVRFAISARSLNWHRERGTAPFFDAKFVDHYRPDNPIVRQLGCQ